jgi:hypothetical protein
MTWVIVAFFVGGAFGVLIMALAAAASDDEWKTAYLNCRDQLWKLKRDQGGA